MNNNEDHEHLNDTSSFLNNYTADEVTKKQLDQFDQQVLADELNFNLPLRS